MLPPLPTDGATLVGRTETELDDNDDEAAAPLAAPFRFEVVWRFFRPLGLFRRSFCALAAGCSSSEDEALLSTIVFLYGSMSDM